jgi:hypothetical protein
VAGVPDDGFFEPVDFIGALAAALELDWTRGWTTAAQN